MDCRTYPLGTLESYTYVVVFSLYEGKLLFSRHKRRGTFETQGGHIEPGETPLEAAERELFEESGAVGYEIRPAFDYWAEDAAAGAGGRVFVARIHKIGSLPESEIAETALFTRSIGRRCRMAGCDSESGCFLPESPILLLFVRKGDFSYFPKMFTFSRLIFLPRAVYTAKESV